MAVGGGYRKMMARVPVHADRRLIPYVSPRIALSRGQKIDAESIHAVLQAGPPKCMVVCNQAKRSGELQGYVRAGFEEIRRAEQTDAALTKIKARGEQWVECSKRGCRTSAVAAGYACRGANLRVVRSGSKGVCGVVGGGPGAYAIAAK